MQKRIKVLIIDDSLLYRETLARSLAADSGIEVVGTAADVFIARDMILQYEPDVLTLDVEMTRMNGIEFLKRLMPQYPLPVVVVSALPENALEALHAGAVDFVSKVVSNEPKSYELFVSELLVKIKVASTAQVGQLRYDNSRPHGLLSSSGKQGGKIVAIGASTGGAGAIHDVLRVLPADMPGIVAVLHMPPGFTRMYAERINNSCKLEVKEAKTGDEVVAGKVLLAPGDYHMRIVKQGRGYVVECFKGEKVNGHCPSVDVLFKSVAEQAGKASLGVILTGMGHDGAQGLLKMREQGAYTIGQDQYSSVVYGMPKVAYEIGAVTKQAKLKEIPHLIHSMI